MVPSKAARALEAALVNQFGESARGTVEAEVGSFLRRSGIRGFQRSDLDAIENGILEKVKEKRQVCHVSSVGQASVPIKAEETPRPKSAATLTTEVRGSKSAPQLAVLAMAPKPQLLKAPDCFDLWREFDSMQHASEEAEKRRNKQAQAKRYLEALNEQLQQAQARKDAEVVEKQRDRQAILEEVQRSHRNASAELQKKQQKKQLQKEAALDLLARVEKQKGAAVQRLQVAKMAMDRTLAAEEQYRQQDAWKSSHWGVVLQLGSGLAYAMKFTAIKLLLCGNEQSPNVEQRAPSKAHVVLFCNPVIGLMSLALVPLGPNNWSLPPMGLAVAVAVAATPILVLQMQLIQLLKSPVTVAVLAVFHNLMIVLYFVLMGGETFSEAQVIGYAVSAVGAVLYSCAKYRYSDLADQDSDECNSSIENERSYSRTPQALALQFSFSTSSSSFR